MTPSAPPPPDELGPHSVPTIEEIRANRARLGDLVLTTPVRRLEGDAVDAAVGTSTRVWLKEELFQKTGSFKPRGALSVMLDLDEAALARGVTGVSAGNHAISLAYCARILHTTAKIVMPQSADPFRVELCAAYGGKVELVDDVHAAFDRAEEIVRSEGRTMVHPFEGPKTALGTAGVGLELVEQVRAAGDSLDAVVVAVGGGGLSAGVSSAVRQLLPEAAVFAVEPEGADSLHRSFESGRPEAIEAVRTIADSLGAPRCEPYSLGLNRLMVNEVVLVTDDQIRDAMRLLFSAGKLVTEPAGAAALAAVMHPLRGRLDGARVGVVVCGANIGAEQFARHLRGE
jgi:threonine dehydratase